MSFLLTLSIFALTSSPPAKVIGDQAFDMTRSLTSFSARSDVHSRTRTVQSGFWTFLSQTFTGLIRHDYCIRPPLHTPPTLTISPCAASPTTTKPGSATTTTACSRRASRMVPSPGPWLLIMSYRAPPGSSVPGNTRPSSPRSSGPTSNNSNFAGKSSYPSSSGSVRRPQARHIPNETRCGPNWRGSMTRSRRRPRPIASLRAISI
jgi:hypothetical protein